MTVHRKAVALLSQEPKAREVSERLLELQTAYKERAAFIEKQLDDLNASHQKECLPLWAELEQHLISTGALDAKTFSTENDQLHIDREAGVVYHTPGGAKCGCPVCRGVLGPLAAQIISGFNMDGNHGPGGTDTNKSK